MKKHHTQVPDFSHQKKTHPDADPAKAAAVNSTPAPRPKSLPKPRATSSKSGRRGT